MAKITIHNVDKSFGGRDLLKDLNFEAGPGDRLAVAGPNGCGKSTLLKILAGKASADTGQVVCSKGAMIGYVAQELDEYDLETNLLTWILEVFPSWRDFWSKWEKAAQDKDEATLAKLAGEQEELEHKYGYNPEHKARAVLTGLGFAEKKFHMPIRMLSGGWRERAKLARVLLEGSDVLLLDEPTNHLDLEAVKWLEEYLMNFKGALVFVAHDRVFLDKVATHVLFIAPETYRYRKGNFSQFLAWEEETARLREKEAAKLSARIESEYSYIRRFRVKARKAAQAQSKLKKVEKLESELNRLETRSVTSGRTLSFTLPAPPRGDKAAATAIDMTYEFDDGFKPWPELTFTLFRGKKAAILAPNGAGKTTLLKLIAGVTEPTSGQFTIGPNTKPAYFSQHQTEILNTENTVEDEMRRLVGTKLTDEEIKGALGLFLLGEPFFQRPVSALSGGEKSRLVLASLFMAKANLLIMDEPTNHLDLESRQALVDALYKYQGTILLVAHDRYLLSKVADEIWALSPDGLEIFPEGFDEYMARISQKPEEEKKTEAARKPSKELKRRQAELRNEISRRLKPLKDNYAKVERELEKLLEEQEDLELKLNDPKTYEKPEEAVKMNKQYQECSTMAEDLFEKLGLLDEEIKGIEAEKESLLSP